MDKTKKKRIKRITALVCVAVVVLLLACMPLLAKNADTQTGPKASILSGTVKSGTIENALIGGGTLTQEAAETITVPSAVRLTNFFVANGDKVSAGDAIAGADRVSVMKAIAQVQETLEYLSEQIEAAGDQSLSGQVIAQAGGTVKHIYAKKGDSVQDVMLTYGALAVISLDGRMSVTFQTQQSVSVADAVTVTLSDGTSVSGTVESSLAGTVKVLVLDKNYTPGDAVTVTLEDIILGTGTLEINSPWKATAYAGTVSKIKVSQGSTVDAGDTLMILSDTGHTAAYQQLLDQRAEYEQMMLELFQMYQTQTVTAPCDGVVSGIDTDSVQLLKASGGTLSLLANAPNGDDTLLYTNYIGQVAAVGQNGWAVLLNPQIVEIADYKELTGVNTDTAVMTDVAIYPAADTQAPLYELQEGQWVQAPILSVQAGDVILFAGDGQGNFLWLVRIKKAQTSTQPETPSGGQIPTPGQNQTQTQRPGGSFNSQSQQQEETFELYGLETAQIASVTPQQEMTLEITVDEMDILLLQIGQTADITVDALAGNVFSGTVSDISTTGTSNGGSSKFAVTLTLPRDENMLSGMNATATIRLESQSAVLTVPLAALAELGTKTVIYTGYNEKNETLTDPVEVTLGVSDGENVQLLSGLQENDTYYYSYYDTLEISYTPDFGTAGLFGR